MWHRIFTATVVLVSLFVFGRLAAAEDKIEHVDEDKDGRAEAAYFYEDGRKVRAEVDANGDGKPDRWVKFKNEKRISAESDRDFDGQADLWEIFDSNGVLKRSARDTNHDRKPDQYNQMLKGRELVLKEHDRNFDGLIDRRVLAQWDPNKKVMTGMIGNRMIYVPNPGYINLWVEEDNDFDGKIDNYREKGNADAAKAKIGKPMNPQTYTDTKKEEAQEAPAAKAKTAEDRIRELNEKYGLT